MRIQLASLLISTALPFTALAAPLYSTPYVGVEYHYAEYGEQPNVVQGQSTEHLFDEKMSSGRVYAGMRMSPDWGFEAGYIHSENSETDNVADIPGLKSEVMVRSITFDVLGYLPATDNLELVGLVGAAYSKLELQYSGIATGKEKDSEVQPRVGAGFQYWLGESVALRTLVGYQAADYDDTVDGQLFVTAGMNAHF